MFGLVWETAKGTDSFVYHRSITFLLVAVKAVSVLIWPAQNNIGGYRSGIRFAGGGWTQ